LENAGIPENPPRVSAPSTDDIPIACRETPVTAAKPQFSQPMLIAGLATIGIVALAAGGLFALSVRQTQDAATGTPTVATSPQSPTPTATDTILGHYAYSEVPQSELESIVPDGSIRLRRAAARAFKAMAADAQAEGIYLTPISGFRSIDDQQYLYFSIKSERRQTASERAKVSAPPGYSEHHTGYAIDIGDGNAPATNLRQDFEGTAAYRWLRENAARYSFELSFPRNNRQGVSYEPWHWRYVGDMQSLKTFYKARSPRN
jgi:D-alanyl-D-alanine carboxypeptidase